MKCKNCGGEIRLEDLYCPYCGGPNEEAHMHARDMQHYRRAFQQTRQDVIERAGTQSRRAIRIAAVAFLAVAIGVNVFLQANSYALNRMFRDSALKRNIPAYVARLNAFLEEEDYIGFSAFCSNKGLSMYDKPFEDYYVIYRTASDYKYAVEELMQLINPGRYSSNDYVMKYASEQIQSFYEDLDPEKYSYYDNYDTPFVQKHLENMADAMDALCIAYLDMTPEEAHGLRSMTRGNRIILIERGIANYE